MITSQNLDDRIRKCQKILDDDPNSQIFAALADAYRRKGELDQAFKVCQNGLKIHPSYGAAHVVMAKINLDRGLYDWAGIEAEKAVELDGKTRTIELLLAEIYIYKGEFKKAIQLLEKLSANDPHNTQIKRLLEIAQRIPNEQTEIIRTAEEPKAVVDKPKEEVISKAETVVKPEAEDKSWSDKEFIEQSIKIPGIDGVMVINNEGLVLESEWTVKLDENTSGATLSEVGFFLNQELVNNSFGHFHSVMIEVNDYTFFLKKVHCGLALLVVNEKANIGSIRMKVEKLLESYR